MVNDKTARGQTAKKMKHNLIGKTVFSPRTVFIGFMACSGFFAMLTLAAGAQDSGPLSSPSSSSSPAAPAASRNDMPGGDGASDLATPDEDSEKNRKTIAALERRIRELEGEVLDLRVMVGTLSSLRQPPVPVVPGGPRAMDGGPSPSSMPWQNEAGAGSVSAQGAQPSANARPSLPPSPPVMAPEEPAARQPDISTRVYGPSDRQASRSSPVVPGNENAAGTGGRKPVSRGNDIDAQTLYKDAYSHMLRRDYASAQNAFASLVKNYPQSRMAGNAQYWLGETFYVRGQYRPAADAFLKAYRNYPGSMKAPDSLMKLALSLARLGQKGAACKTFDELDAKFPNAPSHVRQRAGMEKRRAGCAD